jgi:alkyl hydroperoxide reductase subunit AhpF
MLDDTLKSQLQQYLGMLRQPITLIASLNDSETGVEMRALLETIAGLSDKVTLDTSGDDARKPSFVIARAGETTPGPRIHLAGARAAVDRRPPAQGRGRRDRVHQGTGR